MYSVFPGISVFHRTKAQPIGVYGASKAAGEVAVQKLLGDQGEVSYYAQAG